VESPWWLKVVYGL
jgi:hypothetical protein